jgi:riboflavin biosynthesis pyrimidine reductase
MHQLPLTQLLPPTGATTELHGLYLDEGLHRRGSTARPFVYSNYVSSIDGRIALPSPDHRSHQVPPAISNARDWRLFQELAAQADVLITSARYFRQAEAGEHQDQLPVGPTEDFADLRAWRLQQGLAAQPDVVILSNSLDIPVAALQGYPHRNLYLATGAGNDLARARSLARAAGIELLQAGSGATVDGADLLQELGRRGYRSVYAIAGPAVLNTLLRGGVLDRLYLTHAHRLLGGMEFDTLNWGPVLNGPVALEPVSLYLDRHAPQGASQLFAAYDCHYPESTP